MTRLFGVWVLFMVVGGALVFLASIRSNSSFYDFAFQGSGTPVTGHNRKLKENHQPSSKNSGRLDVEDYHLIDPAPSSKATIRHKPIEHGSPLMPYIPRAPPRSRTIPGEPPGVPN